MSAIGIRQTPAPRYFTRVKNIRSRVCCALLALTAALMPRLSATTVAGPSFEQMVERAEVIFTGRMTGQRSEWRNIEGKPAILTFTTFEVLEVHKGSPGAQMELQFLGGTVGDATLEVAAIPKFKRGDRVVLFVEKNGINASPLVGFYHGKFSLQADGAGGESVAHHDGSPVTDLAEIGKQRERKPDARTRMSKKEFAARIHDAARGSRKP